jgi:hypothetical protein
LLTVADLSAPWQLELEIPDDRVGHVAAARQTLGDDLTVRFRLASDERQQHTGHIKEIAGISDVRDPSESRVTPVVLATVALDAASLNDDAIERMRPGTTARASVYCGRRSLGYVWFHDIWDTLVEWATF